MWQDECRASLTAAKITLNLDDIERSWLVDDALYRAGEYGHNIEMDDFMKEMLYGYPRTERNITGRIPRITYIKKERDEGIEGKR